MPTVELPDVDPPTGDGYLTLPEFRDQLANGGGAGARTAAELPDPRLEANLSEAEAVVLGRLRRFTLPAPGAPEVPTLLKAIIGGFAGYTATLEFYGSQPLEDRDPVVLRYAYAREQLRDLVTGALEVDGIDPADGETPAGDPETYQQTPDLGLAAGIVSDPYSWGAHSFVSGPYGGGVYPG